LSEANTPFGAFDVYPDRIAVQMLRVPDELIGDPALGDIHGVRRHGIDYVDAAHPVHDSYMSGNAEERRFSIPLEGCRRPDPQASRQLEIAHETSPGQWREAKLAR
jgi:hypothetical protein